MSELSRAANAAASSSVSMGNFEDQGDFEILSNSSSSSSSDEEDDDGDGDVMDVGAQDAPGRDQADGAAAEFGKLLQQRFTAGRWEGLVTSSTPRGDERYNSAGDMDEEDDDSDEIRRRQKILKKQQFDAHLDAGSQALSDEGENDDEEVHEDGEREGDEDEPKVSVPSVLDFSIMPNLFFLKGSG